MKRPSPLLIPIAIFLCLASACGVIPLQPNLNVSQSTSTSIPDIGMPADLETEGSHCGLTMWIAPDVPTGIRERFFLPAGVEWAQTAEEATLTLTLSDRVPDNHVILAQTEWVFAVVAPGRSVRVDVSGEDIKSAFQGYPRGSTMQLERLAIYESDYDSLNALLGKQHNAQGRSQTVVLFPDDLEKLDKELNSKTWAIVPIQRLQPEYKLIIVDGISPLQEDFDLQEYLLRGTYSLSISEYYAPQLASQTKDGLIHSLLEGGEYVPPIPEVQVETQAAETTEQAQESIEITESAHLGENEQIRQKDGAVEIFIPTGEVTIGCDASNNGGFECLADELPLHTVTITEFFLDKHEITNTRYAMCVSAGICEEPILQHSATRQFYYGNPDYSNYPVLGISWQEADTYCRWVGGRLPTEAEWERAARGTTVSVYPWGDEDPSCRLANSKDEESVYPCVGDSSEVGSRPKGASPFGIMDMAGNVWEWVNDWYSADYYGHSPVMDPMGADNGYTKLVKGGSWDYSWSRLRVSYNSDHEVDSHKISFGFRCARPVEP